MYSWSGATSVLDAIQDFIRDTTLGGIAVWNANAGRDSAGNAYLFAVDGNRPVRFSIN